MAKQAAEFIAATVTDPELAAAFQAEVGGRCFEEAADDLVAFARERGYQLDRRSLIDTRAALAEAAQGERPLDDAELGQVTGGIFGSLIASAAYAGRDLLNPSQMSHEMPQFRGYDDPKNRKFWLGF